MANYLSQPYEALAPSSSINQPLMEKVLAVREGKYNANKAKIDQIQAQFNNNLKGLRESDNEYISAKLAEASDFIQNFGNRDLSLSSNADTLLNKMDSVLQDPVVQSAIKNKGRYDSYNASVQAIQKKDPKAYSDVNYNYGLYKGGFDAYMNGGIKDLGNMQYVPYKDLTEEHLKKLKTVKDLKGKRFIEEVSPDGKYKIRKEIDGMTDVEIQDYFGSLMTPEELTQMKINGWARYGVNKEVAVNQYKQYNTSLLDSYQKEYDLNNTKVNNDLLSASEREQARLLKDSLSQTISNTKQNIESANSLDIENIGLALEKANYLKSLSELASSEWSQSIDKNDVYYADQDLDIKRQNLQLQKDKFEFEQIKELNKQGLDKNGNLLNPSEIVSVSTREGELPEDVDGLKSLQEYHNLQYNTITDTHREIVRDAPQQQKADYISNLKKLGLDENLEWISGANQKNSKATIIKQAFDKTGLGEYKKYADKLTQAYDKKIKASSDILEVQKTSYSKKFNENPDKYINFLKIAERELQPDFSIVSDIVGNKNNIEIQKEINSFITQAGGWDNLKSYLDKNPNKLVTFGKLTEKADNAYKGVDPYIKSASSLINPIISGISNITNDRNIYTLSDVNLVEDAKKYTEEELQRKSRDGSLNTFTVYDDINVLNETVRENIISKLSQNRLQGSNFNSKRPITINVIGDQLEITQFQGTDKDGIKKLSKSFVDKGDASYQEILKYVDLKQETDSGLKADKSEYNTLPFFKPNAKQASEDAKVRIENNIIKSIQGNPSIGKIFLVNPTSYSSVDRIQEIYNINLKDKIDKQTLDVFNSQLANNINKFKVQVYPNTDPTGDDFTSKTWHMKIINPDGSELNSRNLGLKNLDKDTRYLLEFQPHIFIADYILGELVKNPENINTILKN